MSEILSDELDTESLTQSYDEPSAEEVTREKIIEEFRELLMDETKITKQVIRRLKSLASQADSTAKKEIDSLMISQMPNKLAPKSTQSRLYACIYQQLSDEEVNVCNPACLQGYQLGQPSSCQLAVYQKRRIGMKKLTKEAGDKSKEVHLYIPSGMMFSEEDVRELFARESQAQRVMVYEQDPKIFNYVKHSTFKRTTATKSQHKHKRIEGSAAAVVLVFVLFVVVVLIALALRYWSMKQ